jgi:NAD(P)-dependent dehydrogenase (short-subunit alcohol dehydrogenase family)
LRPGIRPRHARTEKRQNHQHCLIDRPYGRAIIGFVKALARELGPESITVNAICPGSANTDMPRRHRTEEETMARLRSTPLGHVLEPDDIAGPILFLASDAAAYITGQVYNINCGTVMI